MAKLDFQKNKPHDLATTWQAMVDAKTDIVILVNDLIQPKLSSSPLSFLNNTTVYITHMGRSFTPDFKSYDDLSTYFSSKNLPSDTSTIMNKFFSRPSKMISENEWIYKETIYKSSDPLNDRKFAKYSPHFWVPGKAYSSAIDISVQGFTQQQVDAIVNYLKNGYAVDSQNRAWMEIMAHTVDTNGYHIHIGDMKQYALIQKELIQDVNNATGYTGITTKANIALPTPGTVPWKGADPKAYKSGNIDQDDCKSLVDTDQDEMNAPKYQGEILSEKMDRRLPLGSVVDDQGLMEVLRIGDIDLSVCPIAQISYSQSSQFARFSALRTDGDPKIVTESMPTNITINIIFPNSSSVNDEMQDIIANFMVTPVTVIQSRFIARMFKSLIVDNRGNMIDNPLLTAEQESLWMIMTDINIRSIPEFPESFELYLTLEYFEDRVFGNKLEYLVDVSDIQEKYRKKQSVLGNQYVLPSDKSMMESVKSFKSGTINTTIDPNQSSLYHDFYSAVSNSLPNFDINDPNISTLEVVYNSQDFSRDNIRMVKQRLATAYDAGLVQTQKLVAQFTPEMRNWAAVNGMNPYTPDLIQEIAKGTSDASLQQLALALENSNVITLFRQIQYAPRDLVFKARALSKDMDVLSNGVFTQLHITDSTLQSNLKVAFQTALATAGTLQDYAGAAIFSAGTSIPGALSNPAASSNIGMVDGLGGGLEVIIKTKLFQGIDTNNVEAISKRAELIQKALKALAELTLNGLTPSGQPYLDADGMPMFPNRYTSIMLLDGKTTICNGISFTMSNKVIPQQVIGWRQPTYQHMGRSDWSINMNIICKGDEGIRRIMYIMNRLGILSKQIQLTSPMKFMNLDTVLHITKGDPIFGALGVESFVLNTAEISTVPGQLNTYQINLGLEQSKLDIWSLESINNTSAKMQNQLINQALLGQIVPILKAMVVRKTSPNYGRFLDFQQIQSIVDSPALKPLWVAYGLNSADGKSQYDYMDKYNFFKMAIQQSNINNPEKNWDVVLANEFPVKNDGVNWSAIQKNLKEQTRRFLNEGSLDQSTSDALDKLIYLCYNEQQGNLLWKNGSVRQPDQLALAMEGYFQGIQQLVNSWMIFVSGVAKTPLKKSAFSLTTDINIAAGSVLTGGILIAAAASGPIGWTILGLAAAVYIVTIYETPSIVAYLQDKETSISTIAAQLIPTAFNISINQKVIDIAKEFVCDSTSLNIFSGDFVISTDGKGKVLTLQSQIQNLRNLMGAAMPGCYEDFTNQIKLISNRTGLPIQILDPAYYLYSKDYITVDLVDEMRSNIKNDMSLLVTRMHVNSLQLGQSIEDKFKVDSNLNFKAEQKPAKSDFITDADLKWVVDIKRQIVDLNYNSFKQRDQKSIDGMLNAQVSGDTARQIYFKDQYWDSSLISDKTNAVLELAFTRLQLINNSLKFDLMKQTLDNAAQNIINDKNKVMDNPNFSGDNSADIKEYNRFFRDKEYGTGPVGDPGNITWYDAIIQAGSIENPYKYNTSIDKTYRDKYGTSMLAGFKNKFMRDIINQVDILARCKKAMSNPISSTMFARYSALTADPRMIQKRVLDVQSMQDILYKTSLLDMTSEPIRIFPTFKLYFIEENAPEWGIYNDFYDYSAVQEITVIKDRTSASDTCVIKLSNITGKLTDTFADNLPDYGYQSLPTASIKLKPGTSMLVKMGYSNNQVELPVVFYGIIMEVNPGPVVEIICQGYGAELNEKIAPNEGTHFGTFGVIKALGDVATWALQQATGLNHFGKKGYTNIGVTDSLRLSGGNATGDQGTLKIASFITGLPGLSINDPRDDNVFLPYNVSHITDEEIGGTIDLALQWVSDKLNLSGNLNFGWYIRDMSIWDVLHELAIFSPDFINIVLPYNDNIFPFVPNIRNTVYVGPKRGYYKYTDLYQVISKNGTVNLPDLDQITDLLYKIGMWSIGQSFPKANLPNDNVNTYLNQLDDLLSNDTTTMTIVSTYFHVTYIPTASIGLKQEVLSSAATSMTAGEIGPSSLEEAGAALKANVVNQTGLQLAMSFMSMLTNADTVMSQISNPKPGDFIIHNLDIPTAIAGITKPSAGALDANIRKAINTDVGLNGIYYNMFGDNYQYKKVQQHYVATAYTNILSNNIIATSEGWANRINLICPPNIGNYASIQDVPIDAREKFITQAFDLDDNILDDQIRAKDVFVNNVNPHDLDDTFWAKKALEGSATWRNVINSRYSTRDKNHNPKTADLMDKNGGSLVDNDQNIGYDDLTGQKYNRSGWELIPSRWRVGISLLAEEARNMYNGELMISGNGNIKPYDIIHIIDPVNEMEGSVEVGRVIHSISSQNGFTTRIKPDLIVTQKNRFNVDELFTASSMIKMAFNRSAYFTAEKVLGTTAGGFIGWSTITGLAGLLPGGAAGATATAVTSLCGTVGLLALPAIVAFAGYKVLDNYNEKVLMIMNNIVGKDSLEIMPLTYRRLPYIAGVEGMKKESFMRHLYGMAINDQNQLNIFQRMGLMNAPLEFEFYTKVTGDSDLFAWLQTNILPGSKGTTGLGTAGHAIFKSAVGIGGTK